MKKVIFFASTIIFFGLAPDVFAQGFVPLAPIPGLTQGATADTAGLANFFNNLYKYLIGVAAILAVIMIIWGGLEISTQDSVSKKSDGKQRIYNAIGGLVLILSPVLVFSIINPSILNLSLNLPPIDTVSGSGPNFSGLGIQTPVVDTATGCTVTGTLLKKASCPSQDAAQEFAVSCPGFGGKVSACQTETSSGCADKVVAATCDSPPAGPYIFLDISTAYVPLDLFSDYQPLVSSNANSNNGSEAVRFAATCTQDGGVVCLDGSFFSVDCTYTTPQSTSNSNKCYSAKITCESSSFIKKLDLCSSNPTWNPIK